MSKFMANPKQQPVPFGNLLIPPPPFLSSSVMATFFQFIPKQCSEESTINAGNAPKRGCFLTPTALPSAALPSITTTINLHKNRVTIFHFPQLSSGNLPLCEKKCKPSPCSHGIAQPCWQPSGQPLGRDFHIQHTPRNDPPDADG